MPLDPDVLIEITQTVWSTLLGIELVSSSAALPLEGAALTGFVVIKGASSRGFAVSMTRAAAVRFASKMFAKSVTEVCDDDVVDALGELANTCGGNAKALVSGPSTLSLPTVVRDGDALTAVRGAGVANRIFFRADDDVVVVTVLTLA